MLPPPTDEEPKFILPTPKSPSNASIPVAIRVPNKSSVVESPFQPGRYVDISGYASGDKVSDPYTGKVFLVP
jgi:hypothetical protein